ncbi:serine protease [Actinoalloteichus sp. AHMU CJ021]|uniref:Trypsin n=1 Tax=Actinoalloteichus caeruleus DSM 43889 TaxID=1120930 RepID=A0ABT1JB79_ACTCY|nr:serine protease [Actinoalloteichus caeruleus]AUS79482.1 serine protease [Actinoalloteichus sp. AHMU CJ021]MCP2329760.1 Trypsin [Actinoalloteichus caeruleus DSM 43889]
MRFRLAATAVASAAIATLGLASATAVASPDTTTPDAGVVQPFIVGGEDATEGYEFSAALINDGRHACGGTVIAPEWVLTAAHCMVSYEPADIDVRVGSVDRTQGGEVVPSAEIIIHPDYDDSEVTRVDADIALIRLAEPVSVTPATLSTSKPLPGDTIRHTGWGQECPVGGECGSAEILQLLDTTVIAEGCEYGFNPETEICDQPAEGTGFCYGDSGTGTLKATDGGWELAGIIVRTGYQSSEPLCAIGPGISTDVAYWTPWIEEHVSL